ncbi:MAG: DUF2189 domain-containing protein [Polaromonas sp.]|nr:DUF2189 domain-containing protein [Polaromonas sp.]
MNVSAQPPESSTDATATQPAPEVRVVQPLRLGDPVRWLRAGWRDLSAARGIALFYGICFWLMAVVLGAVFRNLPQYTMSFVSGCFLVGPFLAMGLYEVSRRREQGLPQSLGASLTCWDKHLGSMAMLVLVMLLLELLWGRASLVVFAVFFNTGMPSTAGVLNAVFNPQNWQFIAVYTLVGGVFAGLVFSTCVVSIPMILDRDTDAITAGIASIELVARRTGPMLLWGALIVGLVLGAILLPWSIGLLVVGPWLGHASWHAYRGSFTWEAPAPAAGN